MHAYEYLLDPISADRPCGEDLSYSSELDAIAKARLSDDPTLEQGAWVTALKEADWPFVAARCTELLAARSKDLRLAGWLTEAGARQGSLRALADGLFLIAGLCDRYWEQLHPLPDDGSHEQRIGNLCWIAARAPQLLRELALTEGAGSAYSLADMEALRARTMTMPVDDSADALENARRNSSRQFYAALLADIQHCLDAVGVWQVAVDDRLGPDAPGLSAAREVLQTMIHSVLPFAREAGVDLDGEAAPDAPSAAAGQPSPAASAGGQVRDRAQALAQLRQIADFFRRTEPHSPVAYLAEKAAGWGEQPLHLWLRAVVKDPAVCAQLDELLGADAGKATGPRSAPT